MSRGSRSSVLSSSLAIQTRLLTQLVAPSQSAFVSATNDKVN